MSVSIDNIDSYCRVCILVINEENPISIFDEVQGFDMSICDMLIVYGAMTIDDKDVYPKVICDECLRELLIVAKFKEKVKIAEQTLGQLIVSEDRSSNCDEVIIQEMEDSHIDEYVSIKKEANVYEEEEEEEEVLKTESYEEVEFVDLHEQTETLNAVEFVTIGKGDDEFIDEIIEECSVDESDIVETVVSDTIDTINRSTVKKSPSKQTPQHLSPSDSKVIINFNCAFCGAGFMHSSNLKKHMLTHRSESLQSADLTDQLRIEEPAEPEIVTGKISKKNIVKAHQCEHCDRRFVSRSLLSSHIRTHTGERPFACNQCEKNFATQGGLDLHTRRHLGLKNYVCNICDRRFVESSNLKVHMRTHTGERPHRCNRCNRSFSRVFLLQIHQRTHTGERPHQCPICFKGFAQQGDLSAHRRIHSGERPHQCPICSKGFIKSSALTSHMKRHTDKIVYDASETSGTIVK